MNKFKHLIEEIENKYLISFKPTRQFYESVKIGQKRWHQILRNEKEPMIDELKRLAKYFGLSINDLIEED